MANVTLIRSASDWLFSEDHWLNAGRPTMLSLPLSSDVAGILMLPTGTVSISFLPAELSMVFAPIALYWIYSTFLFLLSHLKLTMVEIHRIPTDQPLRKPNRVTVSKVIYAVALQHFVQAITAVVLVILTRPENVENWKMESPLMALIKIAIASVILDTYQYWMHRWGHTNRTLYRWFHSVHHELTVPFAYGALYNHPVEGFFMDTIGSGLPSLLLNMHPWTSAIFYSIATLKTVDDHCGYSWPWSPAALFNANGARYHDIHHWGKGRMYNFSQPFYTFWDHLMGTEYDSAMARKTMLRENEALLNGKSLVDSDSDASSSIASMALDTKPKIVGLPAASPKSSVTVGTNTDRSLRVRKGRVLDTPSCSSDDGGSFESNTSPTRVSKRLSEKKLQ